MLYRRDENGVDHKNRRCVVNCVSMAIIERVDHRVTRKIGAVEDRLHADGLSKWYGTCTARACDDNRFAWGLRSRARDSNSEDKYPLAKRRHCAKKISLQTRPTSTGEEMRDNQTDHMWKEWCMGCRML